MEKKTHRFEMVFSKSEKEMLEALARGEGCSKGNLIRMLIAQKFNHEQASRLSLAS